jgi:hypothetical protein
VRRRAGSGADRLLAARDDLLERLQQRRRERVARLAAQVDDAHRRQRAGDAPPSSSRSSASQLSGRGVALPKTRRAFERARFAATVRAS